MKTFLNQTTNFGLLLFILLSAFNIYKDVTHDIKYMNNIKNIHKQMHRIDKNSQMILEIQKERGLTSIYFENTSKKHLNKILSQRKDTSKVMLNSAQVLNLSIDEIRVKADEGKKNKLEVFYAYSELIRSLLLDTQSLTFHTDNNILKNELIIYNDLNNLQETLGQIRAKVGVILSAGVLNKGDKLEVKRLNILFGHHLETTFVNDIITSRKYTRSISKTKCLKKSLLLSKILENELNPKKINLSAIEWFNLSTCAITKINSFVEKQKIIINIYLDNEMKKAQEKRMESLIFWLLGAGVLLILVLMSFKRSKELLKEQALLKNYKKAIDYASFVSKTDKDGVITYVNDNFSKLSGYTSKELIGNKHSLIRHPDIPDKTFDLMWETITQGKKWKGLLKNKKKDGTVFWADTSIVPIYDDHGKLIEYIAIRDDISEIVRLNDEIEETQRELIYRLGEAVESRSKESGHHIKRVAHYSKLLAELMDLSHSQCELIFAASSMHDVGKIAIPDSILLKPGKLDNHEWQIMKLHADIGYKLFKNSQRPMLQASAEIAHEHHEHYNGKGYPRGIKGDEISIFGRIVAIADVFDALYTERVYKDAWPLDKIMKLFKEESGKQFDPDLATLFIDNINQFLEINELYK